MSKASEPSTKEPLPAQVSVTPLGNGRYRVSDGVTSRLAYAAGPADARWVFLDGRVYLIENGQGDGTKGRSSRSRGRDDGSALAAPMPATVTIVNVTPGQEVAQGDVLILLEAMKMELPIKAPRAGRVKTVACRQGELVQAGVPLLELE